MGTRISFKVNMIERGAEFVKFRLQPVNGACDVEFTRKVYDMFIDRPLLHHLKSGYGYLFGEPSHLSSQNLNYGVEEDENGLVINLFSTLFRNKEVSKEEMNDVESYLYIGDRIFSISGVGYAGIMASLALDTLVQCLDGMEHEVEDDYFEPRCSRCVFNRDNIKDLGKLRRLHTNDEMSKKDCICIMGNEKECLYFEHEDGPSFSDIHNTLKDVFDI